MDERVEVVAKVLWDQDRADGKESCSWEEACEVSTTTRVYFLSFANRVLAALDAYERERPHTVWWWDDRDAQHLPAPLDSRFDTRSEAVAYARSLCEPAPSWLAWVKVFRSDNEKYVAFRWKRGDEGTEQPDELTERTSPLADEDYSEQNAQAPEGGASNV